MPEPVASPLSADAILKCAGTDTSATGKTRRVLDMAAVKHLAATSRKEQREIQGQALLRGIVPKRYLRNFDSLTTEEQAGLLHTRVLLVGLGGLGGTVLEILARMGVGTIIGADGDVFEESNLNRQALCTESVLGQPKSSVAAARVRDLNADVHFVAVNRYLHKEEMRDYCAQADLVVDCLGGLDFRTDLHQAAQEAGLPLVSAAVAGWSGFVGSQQPGETGLEHFFQAAGSGGGAEETLGCPAPGVRFAATLQASEALRILLARQNGKAHPGRILLFDLADFYFEKVQF